LITWSAKLFWWLLSHRNDYDVIHIVHGRLHALPAVLAGYVLDKPTMIKIGRGGVEHFDLDVVRRKKVLGRCYARAIANIADAYIANSSAIAGDLERWEIPNSRVHRVPNGVEIPPLSAPERPRRGVRCVFVGRLEVEKSLDLMVRGFAKLSAAPLATLTIVGDGNCRRQLEALVDELGVADRVFFAGPVGDVRPFLRDADIFVSTSSSEGMSNALLEAMSFGIMPLVSLVSGVTDVVEDGCTGLLFAAGDLQAFATRLNEAVQLTDADRRKIGLRGRESVERRFGIDEIARRHLDIYQMLVGPGSANAGARDIR
jgi:glycosyltransferase involved in cell wall biosynthesis